MPDTVSSGVPRHAHAPGVRPWRRASLASLLGILAAVSLLLLYIGVIGGNVREVVPGQVYRSAQLSASRLGELLEKDHIRTVINLRNGSHDRPYYQAELSECARRGVAHLDIPMSAVVLPPPEQLRALLDAFDHAATPVLFHCEGGADRSGLAGTLYLAIYRNVPLDEAEANQLTWRYAHFSFGQAHAMNDFFDLYRKTANGLGLREWIVTRYPLLFAGTAAASRLPAVTSP